MFKKSPALFLLIFVVTGILVADYYRFDISYFFLSLVLFVVGSLFCYKSQKEKLLLISIGLGLLSFVGVRFASMYYESGPNHISNYIDSKSTYVIYGKVADWPELKSERTELTIDVDSLENVKTVSVRGKILLKINSLTTSFQRGDNLVLEGRIYAVEGKSFSKEFNYNRFLRYKEICGVVYLTTPLNVLHDKVGRYSLIPLVEQLRNAITKSLYRNLSPVSAALASGFLIGETRDIPPELYTRFKDSGTLHLLAVSGSNVILVITFFSFLFNPLLKNTKKRALFLMAVVILFSLLSYGEPSVLRASLMAGLVLGAGLVERRYQLQNLIAVAAFLILLYDPSQLFDLGFQLSFVIAWGLILVVPKLNILLEKHHLKKWYEFLLFPFLISLTAQIFSFGLIGLYFKQIPLLSPIANLFVVPLVSAAVIGVLVLLVADFILPLLGLFVGAFLNLLLTFTVYIVDIFGAGSMPMIKVYDWTIIGVICLYIVLFMAPFALLSKTNRRKTLIVMLVFLNIFAINQAITALNRYDYISVLCTTVPGGNMAIVNIENNEVDLIINGIKGKSYLIDEKIIIPKLESRKIKKIDKLIVLKSDYSAIDDLLRIAERYEVNSIYLPKSLQNSFIDKIKNTVEGLLAIKLEVLQELESEDFDIGYSLYENSFSLKTTGYEITFVDKISQKNLQPFNDKLKRILIIGSSWNISLHDYLTLKDLQYEKVICSKIAQTNIPGNEDVDLLAEDLFVDLYNHSEYLIQIPF